MIGSEKEREAKRAMAMLGLDDGMTRSSEPLHMSGASQAIHCTGIAMDRLLVVGSMKQIIAGSQCNGQGTALRWVTILLIVPKTGEVDRLACVCARELHLMHGNNPCKTSLRAVYTAQASPQQEPYQGSHE